MVQRKSLLWAEPAEMAGFALYYASGVSTFAAGIVLQVDDGYT